MHPSESHKPSGYKMESANTLTKLGNMLGDYSYNRPEALHFPINFIVSPERYQHFNKQSVKVNNGLTFRSTDFDRQVVTSAFASDVPPTDIDFSVFIVPASTSLTVTKVSADTVHRLLNPPKHAFTHGVLSINWVIGLVGAAQFRCRERDERFLLKKESILRIKGRKLGLPAAYHEWLCGDDPGGSSTEEGTLLTKEFFEKDV